MKPQTFRKKPVEIEALQFTIENASVAVAFCGGRFEATEKPSDPTDVAYRLAIPTLEGVMQATPGDWIIKGVQGEFYPCKPDIFAATYEAVEK